MKRKLTALLCLLSLILVISGCKNTEPQDSVAAKTVLILATVGSHASVALVVESYNEQSGDYIVEVRDYETYHELFSELNGPGGPDMFFLAATPILLGEYRLLEHCEDLGPFLNADSYLDADNFVSGLQPGLQRNGSMSWLPYDFTMFSFAAQPPADAAGEPFTVELARKTANERGEYIFPAAWTRDMLLDWVAPYLSESYVDWDSMTCSYGSSGFIALLEELKAHPASFDDIPENRQSLINPVWIDGTFGMLGLYEHVYRYEEEDYALVGIPGEAANFGIFEVGQCFGMFSSSGDKEAAWQFLRGFMSDEAQNATSDFPAMQSALERRIEEKVQHTEIKRHAADKFLAIVDATTCVRYRSGELYFLVKSGVSAFFEGDYTAQEAGARIQQQATEALIQISSGEVF